jgi:D-Tyr-tRNA(Tyr) deacylase
MRAVIQRVNSASVVVDGKTVGSIGKGLVALVGLHESDDFENDGKWLVSKLLTGRYFADEESGKQWAKSVKDAFSKLPPLPLPSLLRVRLLLHLPSPLDLPTASMPLPLRTPGFSSTPGFLTMRPSRCVVVPWCVRLRGGVRGGVGGENGWEGLFCCC